MARPPEKRSRLIIAANRLFHRQGYDHSSIADIAAAAGVPAGNVYYHFKTKEELGQAVIARRVAFIGAWLGEIEASSDRPLGRLLGFIEGFEESAELRAAYGCPVGGFCHDANRLGGAMARHARRPFEILLAWLERQLTAAGLAAPSARGDARFVLGSLEGASLLAHSFQDASALIGVTARLKEWLADRVAAGAD